MLGRLFASSPHRRSPRALTRIALASLALVAGSGGAFAGSVKGRVVGIEKLVNPVWNEAKDVAAHRFSWREPSPTVRSELRNLFPLAPREICIAAIARGAQQPPAQPIAIAVGGGRTTPVTLVVAPGARLRFENKDPFTHKLFAVGQPSLQPGETARAGVRDWQAPGPGKYEIRDELAPSLRSWIVVEPNVAGVAFPARDGSFAFPNLPDGDYTLRAYFSGAPVGTPQEVRVAGGSLELKDPLALAEGDKKSADKGGK